jgi:hypothetical protein
VCETVLSNAQTYLDDSLSEPETNTQLISIWYLKVRTLHHPWIQIILFTNT